jgi:hypothetical protein
VSTSDIQNATRRRILKAGLAVLGGAVSSGAARADETAAAKPAQEKFTPEAVHYQPVPKDGQKYGPKCLTCAHFEAPAACKIVSGPVSPQGWCTAYALLHE